ncbi:LytTR family DNA-binding domain-containing protein [Clostridium sp. DJ247]|uniref:LytR/AlgR family response regulator transcription factor n=1 Tax=Clostridium sp. DJ247 TaxID=2726188 RepID=UPI001628E065|nr:LytTR family DNA-binding domain-containing protein [Clostridium sp. DJ247]MBC2581543.1 response regulator transcription factor [Clostridium sp. DJ247]
MINILVVEDDEKQRENLVKMIYESEKNINTYEAECKEQALKISKEVLIDFFYIDISLKNSSGLDLALELRNIEKYKFSWVIFITTHVNYMIQAFKEIHCYDYIIKPYDKDEVIEITKHLISGSYMKNSSENKDKHIVFNLHKGVSIRLKVDEIIFIEVNLRVMTIYTKNKNYKVKKLPLKKVLEMIDSDNILQSHKSFAVNIDFINKIESLSNKSWEISFNCCKEKALLSYSFKDTIIKKFNQTL